MHCLLILLLICSYMWDLTSKTHIWCISDFVLKIWYYNSTPVLQRQNNVECDGCLWLWQDLHICPGWLAWLFSWHCQWCNDNIQECISSSPTGIQLVASSLLLSNLNHWHLLEVGALGKYYLVDLGYPNQPGYLAPYKGSKYHLQDFQNSVEPWGKKEVFNYGHSSLRNVIERAWCLEDEVAHVV